jgi:hypothetical protein
MPKKSKESEDRSLLSSDSFDFFDSKEIHFRSDAGSVVLSRSAFSRSL